MARYELGMSLDYVPNWGIVEAVREIFQNALDEEIKNPENSMYFTYKEDEKTLYIGNKSGKLDKSSLLLGYSDKREDDKYIGQHGEGYKIATIVLLRTNHPLTIYNYGKREIWQSKIVKSKRYGVDIGVFDVKSQSIWNTVPNHDLIFKIENVTLEEYNEIVKNNLHLECLGDTFKGDLGQVLLHEKYKGKIFVKGLFVCYIENLKYGYDFDASIIKLDRDRALIQSWDIQSAVAKLVVNINSSELLELLKDTWEGNSIRFYLPFSVEKSFADKICDSSLMKFRDTYGDDAIPVVNTDTFNKYRSLGYNSVMVTDNEHYYITHSSLYSEIEVSEDALYDKVKTWFDNIKPFILDENLLSEGENIMELLKNKL